MTPRLSEAAVGGILDFSIRDCLPAGKSIEPNRHAMILRLLRDRS